MAGGGLFLFKGSGDAFNLRCAAAEAEGLTLDDRHDQGREAVLPFLDRNHHLIEGRLVVELQKKLGQK